MGAIEVKYKSQRGSHDPGTPVTDPKDWITTMMVDDFEAFKAKYETLSSENKQALLAVLDSEDAMDNKGTAGMWLAEHDDDTAEEWQELCTKI